MAAMAAMDISNFTSIRMRHGMQLPRKVVLSKKWPRIVAFDGEVVLDLPYVSRDREEILEGLRELSRQVHRLTETVVEPRE
jgi:hypothetical protein